MEHSERLTYKRALKALPVTLLATIAKEWVPGILLDSDQRLAQPNTQDIVCDIILDEVAHRTRTEVRL